MHVSTTEYGQNPRAGRAVSGCLTRGGGADLLRWGLWQQGRWLDTERHPALLSKKAGKPVMMRNARDEENAEHPAAPDKILLLRNRLTRSEWSDGAP